MMARRALLAAEMAPGEVQALNRHIQEGLMRFPLQEIAGYMPLGSECNIQYAMSCLHDLGHKMSLPVVKQKDRPLLFRRWLPGSVLQQGPYGVAYPPEQQPEVTPALLLVPLLAYDDAGYRIGYGGGYYDRTLAKLRRENAAVVAVGIAYSGQKIEAIPAEPLDEPLNAVITEKGWQAFSPVPER